MSGLRASLVALSLLCPALALAQPAEPPPADAPPAEAATPAPAPAASADAPAAKEGDKPCEHCAHHKDGKPCAMHHEPGQPCPCGEKHADNEPCPCGGAMHEPMGRPVINDSRFEIDLGGYINVQGATFVPGRFFGIKTAAGTNTNPNVGQNDGFALGDARLNIRANYQNKVYARLSFDGALSTYDDPNAVVGHLSTGLQDAYLRVNPTDGFAIWAGRFKAPFDAEQLTSHNDQQFVHRAIESRGVMRHEGFGADMPGFATGRQLGLMAAATQQAADDFRLRYALAVTNGNSGDLSLNDNDTPAVWARVGGLWSKNPSRSDEEGPATVSVKDGLSFGLSGFWNTVTTGRAPNRVNDRVFGAGFDAAWRQDVGSTTLDIRGQVLWQNTNHLAATQACAENGLGGHIQVAVRLPETNIYPAFRYGMYEPRFAVTDACGATSSGPDDDRVQHFTGGLRWNPESWPLILWLEYTHSLEQTSRAVNNDRVEAAVQVDFD